MLKIIRLTQKHFSTPYLSFWKNTFFEIASRHFDSVPMEDVTQLFNDAKKKRSTIFMVCNNKKFVGFGYVSYRKIKNHDVLLLEAGCIDKEIRNRCIVTDIGIHEMLRYKFSSFRRMFRTIYAVAVCLSPQGYLVYQWLKPWDSQDTTPVENKNVYDEIMKNYCHELHVEYPGCGHPILFTTWLPKVPSITVRETKRVSHFLEQNSRWQEGFGLPMIIPINHKTIFQLLRHKIVHKIHAIQKKFFMGLKRKVA